MQPEASATAGYTNIPLRTGTAKKAGPDQLYFFHRSFHGNQKP